MPRETSERRERYAPGEFREKRNCSCENPWSVETVPSAITCGARATVTLSRVSGTGLAYGLLA